MFSYGISFERPVWLYLLAVIPLLWWWGQNSLMAFGRARRWAICLCRSLVLALIVVATAEPQFVQNTDRLAVVYLLDQSLSIPQGERGAMIDYANLAIHDHRQPHDLAGAIVFGREPVIESPAYEDDLKLARQVEGQIDPSYTNIAAAIKLAEASFPHDAARRIVLVTDGNENIGDALLEARGAAEAGIGIDVLPIRYATRSEIVVEKVSIPADVRKGQPFDLRVVVNNTNPSGTVAGRLRVMKRAGDQPFEISNEPVELPPGKRVFTIRQEIDDPDFYTYEAQFIPDNPADDAMSQNNRATAFTHVRGSGQVLLIESMENRGEHQQLVDRLRANNIEVTVRPTSQLFNNLAELQQYDTVILGNVPRSDGDDAARITHFTDDQIRLLVRNTEYMGAGLIMLGGPNSFGAGGWTNTELERAMPVDFQVKNLKVVPSGALMLVIDHSGSMSGEKLELSRAAAIAAIKVLGDQDKVGVVTFDSAASVVVPMTTVGDGRRAISRVAQIGSGGGTNMMPGVQEGYKMLAKADASVKHMIVLTDGHTAGSGYAELTAFNRRRGITTTALAVGSDTDIGLMEGIARAGGGKFYKVDNPRAIPRIFMKEAMRVARSVIYEKESGFHPTVRYPHEITSGLTGPLPPLTGYVRTTLKQNPLVEQAIISPVPEDEINSSILATWTYGSGRAVAFTTDDGARWAKQWATWPDYDKFFSQLVRWSMRPTDDQGKFSVATEFEGDRVRIFVTALDQKDEFLNFLNLTGSAIGPDVEPRELHLEQTAPGRYVGEFPVEEAGSYFITLSPGAGQALIRAGVNVPYSAEFADRQADVSLLESIAELRPKQGEPGALIEGSLEPGGMQDLLAVDSFRRDLPKASRAQDVWHLLVLSAACLFFCDVFLRRVSINLTWAAPLLLRLQNRLLGRTPPPVAPEFMSRLQSRKASVAAELDQRRAGARFAPASPASEETSANRFKESRPKSAAPEALTPSPAPERLASIAPPAPTTPDSSGGESYTSRLLKAKKKVWEQENKGPE
ncbi:MAG TPA: VWA domain-containing protein [Pirellulales bacterium]|jgi:Mg-chelatase subunit ChlD